MERVSTRQKNVDESCSFPGLVVGGLCGGSGKTMFSVGIIAALRFLGFSVAPFKKGPDYIDAGWLALAAGQSCHNLDTFLMRPDVVLLSYQKYARCANFSLVEGNRGLYDCINADGETSTAALAKLLNLPVVLCVDVTKTTRTMAAIISGLLAFDSDVRIAGVILNRVAGIRHQDILTKCIERYCGVPVLGAIPKLSHEFFPERHMGLVPTPEHKWANASIEIIRATTSKYLDISAVINILGCADAKVVDDTAGLDDERYDCNQVEIFSSTIDVRCDAVVNKPVIGVMRDSAFQFYYPENLEALEKAGARLVFASPLKSKVIPSVDALYIGGGFPETHAKELEDNIYMRDKVKLFADIGMPIYAECGGLIYLGERLLIEGESFKMSGVLPAVFKIWKRPQGHGYTVIKVKKKNPYYPIGSELLGHEFHYSSVHEWKGGEEQFVFSMKRGSGFINGRDGISHKNVMATYTHVHALGTKNWAVALVNRAIGYMKFKKGRLPCKK